MCAAYRAYVSRITQELCVNQGSSDNPDGCQLGLARNCLISKQARLHAWSTPAAVSRRAGLGPKSKQALQRPSLRCAEHMVGEASRGGCAALIRPTTAGDALLQAELQALVRRRVHKRSACTGNARPRRPQEGFANPSTRIARRFGPIAANTADATKSWTTRR